MFFAAWDSEISFGCSRLQYTAISFDLQMEDEDHNYTKDLSGVCGLGHQFLYCAQFVVRSSHLTMVKELEQFVSKIFFTLRLSDDMSRKKSSNRRITVMGDDHDHHRYLSVIYTIH